MNINQAVTEICKAYGCAPREGTPELFSILMEFRNSVLKDAQLVRAAINVLDLGAELKNDQ